IGLIDITASIEPRKISFAAKIVDAKSSFQPAAPQHFTVPLAAAIDADILQYCISLDDDDDPAMTDCNAFVRKVGSHFNVPIPDLNADGIVDAFNASPFTKTTKNPSLAMSWAKDGLVVAGMKRSELNPAYGTHYKNGHVAIVHSSADPNHPGFPMASWGTLG